jgi:uracil-DNA glycosylase
MGSGWYQRLAPEFEAPYMANLRTFLQEEKAQKKTIYPHSAHVFNAFKHTPFDAVKVVILGQDPYHNVGQAHGLCFSVKEGIKPPPSLINIFKELGFFSQSGDLTKWADQGVLLLNSVLTVEAHKAASHQGRGWEQFTDSAIQKLATEREGIVFMLWGSYAQKKGAFIDRQKHLVLTAPHPSPLSAHRGFLGCGHFTKANDYLKSHGVTPIDWQL